MLFGPPAGYVEFSSALRPNFGSRQKINPLLRLEVCIVATTVSAIRDFSLERHCESLRQRQHARELVRFVGPTTPLDWRVHFPCARRVEFHAAELGIERCVALHQRRNRWGVERLVEDRERRLAVVVRWWRGA